MDELEEEETMKIEEEIVEVVEPVVNEIQEEPILKIKEEIVEEVIDVVQEVEEEIKGEITEVVEPVMITLGKMKDLLKQHIPKKIHLIRILELFNKCIIILRLKI